MTVYRLKGTAGPVINQSFPLAGRLSIGNAKDCDVRIGAAGGDAMAVEITLLDDGRVTFTCPIETSAVAVNGVAMPNGSLRSGDELRVGSCAFLLQAPGLRPERLLASEPSGPDRKLWPWLGVAAASLLVLLAWLRGWLG